VLSRLKQNKKYMLFAGWEVHIVKNCDRGLENAAWGRRPRAAFSSPRSQFFTIRTDPHLFFSKLSNKKKTHANVTVTMVRERKIQTTLRTNQIAGFVTVPAWKKINNFISCYIKVHFMTLNLKKFSTSGILQLFNV